MNSRIIKGFHDFIGEDSLKRDKIKKIIQREFELYGFEPAETPIIESESFVTGDNSNDEAVRDVFRLKDRGKRRLALRYEFTFQLKRLSRNQKLPFKRFQIGSVFRDEPIRKGRSREFIQCDADIIGSSLENEVECLKIGKNVFDKLKIPIKIYVNNRKLINEILVSENVEERKQTQVIRELDKLDKLSKKEVADNLKKIGEERILKIFDSEEKNFEKYSFYKEIKKLKKLCKFYNIEIIFKPTLSRGLSYYTGTIFEIWGDDLNVSLSGGGSYLVGDAQATGISFGFEPISMLSTIKGDRTDILILSLGEDEAAIILAENLRARNITVNLIINKSIGKGLEYANIKEVKRVIFVGKNEIEEKKFRVKDMESGNEKMLSLDEILI